MELALSADQLEIRETVQRYLRKSSFAPFPGGSEGAGTCEVVKGLAELGLLGLAVPTDFGGFSGEPEDIVLAAMELGRQPLLRFRFENVILAIRLLIAGGSERATKALGDLSVGKLRPAVALYEELSRFDISKASTAVRDDGGALLLTGRKVLVVDAAESDLLLVVADIASNLGVVAVDRGAAGVNITRYRLLDGTPAADVEFTDVIVSSDDIILQGSAALDQIYDALDYAVVGLCAGLVGSIERSIDLTIEFLSMRKQFGRPLSEFQALQHQVADMYVSAALASSSLYAAVSALRQGREAARRAAAGCKQKVATAAKAVIGQALHLHGGMGFSTEYPIAHHFRRAVVDEKLLGDAEFHLGRYIKAGACDSR